MKKRFTLFLLFHFYLICSAQNFNLKITGSTVQETKIIDSVQYTKTHQNYKSISTEIETLLNTLNSIGYLNAYQEKLPPKNDSLYQAQLSLKNHIKYSHLYIGRNTIHSAYFDQPIANDSVFISFPETERFLTNTIKKLEHNGFPLSKLSLKNIQTKKNILYADLELTTNKTRELDQIVVTYAPNNKINSFPKGHLAELNRKYLRKKFNQELANKISESFDYLSFAKTIKFPEVLFTTDSTKIYVYLEKTNTNYFDGLIGFSQNKSNKTTFNGYADLQLNNLLKSGEKLTLLWKDNGQNQKEFNSSIEISYLFQTKIGIKAQIQIFKQDSLFQNTRTEMQMQYSLNEKTAFYLGYEATESSDIQNSNTNIIRDYNNNFANLTFDYLKRDSKNNLFPNQAKVNFKGGFGKRSAADPNEDKINTRQYYLNLSAMLNLKLNEKNYFNIRSQNQYLNSTNYLTNELYRFGGINSIRGFLDNSLSSNFYSSLLTEYRFVASPTIYLHTILDYGIYNYDNNFNSRIQKLLGFGLGLAISSKSGQFRIALTNGKESNESLEFKKSLLQINYTITF